MESIKNKEQGSREENEWQGQGGWGKVEMAMTHRRGEPGNPRLDDAEGLLDGQQNLQRCASTQGSRNEQRTSPKVFSIQDWSLTVVRQNSHVTDITHSQPWLHMRIANLPAPSHANHSRTSDGIAAMACKRRGAWLQMLLGNSNHRVSREEGDEEEERLLESASKGSSG